MVWGMKVFVACDMEIAECELIAEGLPVTQDGAETLAKRRWRGNAWSRKRRQLRACYTPKH